MNNDDALLNDAPVLAGEGVRYDLEERLLEFAARILRACRAIESGRAGDHVSDQLARSGTSPMAHHSEAESSRSRKDFINKMKVGLQELRESRRWLQLTVRTPLVEKPHLLEPLIEESLELIKIFRASIKTAESNA